MSKIFSTTLVVLIVLLGLLTVNLYVRQKRIAYVRSHEVLEKFRGTIEARRKFESQKQNLMQSADSLRVEFEHLRTDYFTHVQNMSAAERQVREEELDMRQSQLLEYARAVETKITEADNVLMQQVLNQINSSIEDFAKQSGYDIILGTTSDGSLLYGEDALDVTEAVILKLNLTYQGF